MFLFSPRDLRAPSADRRETLPHDRNLGALYNASPKVRGPSHKKLGPKHAKFGPISYDFGFDRECLRNGTRYPKSERRVITSDSSRVRPMKSGELWSTNYRVLHVSLDPPKWNFSTDYISALRRCWPLKFLHALEIDHGLLSHTPNGDGGPLLKKI